MVYRGNGIHVQHSILAPINRALGVDLARISGEVVSIFKELCRSLSAREFSHATQEPSSTCYVTYGRLILALLQQVRSTRRTTFCPRTPPILQQNNLIHSRKDNIIGPYLCPLNAEFIELLRQHGFTAVYFHKMILYIRQSTI